MDELKDANVKILENAALDDVRAGDHLTWTRVYEFNGVIQTECREGIAHERDSNGEWRTASGGWITDGEGPRTTLTIRRPAPALPTEDGAVIVPNDGHETVEAKVGGLAWHAREAMLGEDGCWHGVWHKAAGWGVMGFVLPEHITAPTWKVAGQ